jgi:hypothetical protein
MIGALQHRDGRAGRTCSQWKIIAPCRVCRTLVRCRNCRPHQLCCTSWGNKEAPDATAGMVAAWRPITNVPDYGTQATGAFKCPEAGTGSGRSGPNPQAKSSLVTKGSIKALALISPDPPLRFRAYLQDGIRERHHSCSIAGRSAADRLRTHARGDHRTGCNGLRFASRRGYGRFRSRPQHQAAPRSLANRFHC